MAELKVFLNTDLLFGVSTCCRRVTSEYSATSSLLIRKQLKAADIGRLDRCERKEGKLDFFNTVADHTSHIKSLAMPAKCQILLVLFLYCNIVFPKGKIALFCL